jgi:CheY-like chemotaxis protein
VIRRNIQLEARLIDDLLDLTRITRGKMELHPERSDAHALVREALATAGEDIAIRKQSITTALAAREHFVSVDPVRMRQVLWNLINNAVKFTPPGGSVHIRTANDAAGRFQVEVVDSGIGIEPEQQARLFDAFVQGGPAVTRQFGGLGLGLAIARNIVELHGGAISVESRGRNQGATFRVVLDVLPAGATLEQSGRLDLAPKGEPLRILVVEDHSDTRRVLARLLRHFGHEISVADCVAVALDACRSSEFDAVLSDIGLPDGTGYEIIAEAKRRQPVKGIALTGFGMEEDMRRSKEAGFDFHLTKPIDFAELRTVLAQIAC